MNKPIARVRTTGSVSIYTFEDNDYTILASRDKDLDKTMSHLLRIDCPNLANKVLNLKCFFQGK
jgi:hypothetical protein